MLSTPCLISLPRRRRWGDELERIQYRLSQKPGARKRNLKLNKIPLNYFTRNDRCNIMMHAGVSLNFFSLTIREMSKFDGCYVIPLKALSRGAHGLSINERQNLHQISKPWLERHLHLLLQGRDYPALHPPQPLLWYQSLSKY